MAINERAEYRVLDPAGFYGDDDHLWPEGAEIFFDGTPNEQMEPLNEVAHRRLTAYLSKLDDDAREQAQKAGKIFVGRPRTLDGAIALATQRAKEEMGIMGNKNKVVTTEAVERAPTPEMGSTEPKKSRGRPPGSKNRTFTPLHKTPEAA